MRAATFLKVFLVTPVFCNVQIVKLVDFLFMITYGLLMPSLYSGILGCNKQIFIFCHAPDKW